MKEGIASPVGVQPWMKTHCHPLVYILLLLLKQKQSLACAGAVVVVRYLPPDATVVVVRLFGTFQLMSPLS
jgi:hypothetical protein